MLCPHCRHDNVDGRKYCRTCTKPLAPESIPVKPAFSQPSPAIQTPVASPALPSTPNVNGMAIASLALSFVSFILPLGIAAAVMGHISRSQIVKSKGRQTGTWLAFAGLVITYLQLAVMSLICIAIIAALHGMNRNLDRDPHARAALLAAMYSDHRPTATDYARQRRDAVDAMRLIHAGEVNYIAGHPDEGYACQMYQLGWAVSSNELNMHITNSHYEVKIDQCRGGDVQHLDDRVYAAVALPRSDSNPSDAPIYCVDQTGVVRRYAPGMINDLHRVILFEHKSCPESGEPVE
jgi:hypothetical protein